MRLSLKSIAALTGMLCLSTVSSGELHESGRALQVGRVPMDSEDLPIATTTIATTHATTAHPMEDSGDTGTGTGSSKGSGKGSGKGSSKASGKGASKGERSSEGASKGKGSSKGSGKGSGKGSSKGSGKGSSKGSGKGSSSADSSHVPDPHPVDSADSADSSSSKGSKSTKSTKSDSSDSESDKGTKSTKSTRTSVKVIATPSPTKLPTPAPVVPATDAPTLAPTTSPVAPTPTTPSPTSRNSLEVRASRYSLSYALDLEEAPSESNLAEVTEVTRAFLEDVLMERFSQTSLTNLDDFLTVRVRSNTDTSEDFPVRIEFQSVGLFNPNSIFLPTVRELDNIISEAFEGDNLNTYIQLLNALPSANPLSRTNDVVQGPPIGTTPRASQNGGLASITESSTTTAGIAAAAAGIVVLAAGLVILRRRHIAVEEIEVDCDEEPKKPSKSDKTVSSETCGMSVDTSNTDWRLGKTYVITEENDERPKESFEDEFSEEKSDMKDVSLEDTRS